MPAGIQGATDRGQHRPGVQRTAVIDIATDTIVADTGMERLYGFPPGGMNGSLSTLRAQLVDEDMMQARRLADAALAGPTRLGSATAVVAAAAPTDAFRMNRRRDIVDMWVSL